jgi:hypothetical protein
MRRNSGGSIHVNICGAAVGAGDADDMGGVGRFDLFRTPFLHRIEIL